VAAVVLAVVPATGITAKRVFDGSSSPPSVTSTDLPIPPVSPSASETGPGKPTGQPPATPSKKATAKLPRVAPDAPRRLVSGDLIDTGFDEAVAEIGASSTSEVARWESRGSPGSPGTDTVYVIGRVYADGDSAFADLPRLKPGAKVSIRTDTGTMTYTVSAATLKAEAGLADAPLFTTRKAGRLVLVGIRYDESGDRLGKALVVTAELTGAKAS
jgi:hypothetical protein